MNASSRIRLDAATFPALRPDGIRFSAFAPLGALWLAYRDEPELLLLIEVFRSFDNETTWTSITVSATCGHQNEIRILDTSGPLACDICATFRGVYGE